MPRPPLADVDLNVDGSVGSNPERPIPNCTENCQDFPSEPIFDVSGDTSPPSNAPELFGDPSNGGSTGPCILEPHLGDGTAQGALLPANWLRPRFRFEPLDGEDVWEIRLSAEREANDLVVYTTNTTWTLPKEIWTAVAQNVHLEPITVTIRGLNSERGGTPSASRGTFQIAPVYARGSLVYWAATSQAVDPDTSRLVGFSVGDEGVIDALTIRQVGNRNVIGVNGDALRVTPDPGAVAEPGHVQCIGCHTSTPDGEAVAFTDVWPWNNLLASVEEQSVGAQPDYVTAGAALLLNQPWLGMQTFSPAHWSDARRIVVTTYSRRTIGGADAVGFTIDSVGRDTLAWFDLAVSVDIPWSPGDAAPTNQAIEAARGEAWDLLTMTGQSRAVVSPDLSQDGERIVYTSADVAQDGRIGAGNSEVDVYSVPFNDGAGGVVSAVEGAAQAGVAEYYPAFSADDRFIAFNRVQTLDGAAIYYRPDGEVYLVPSSGGSATRLSANDPVSCSGETSPGVINSWPKWSPSVSELDGKRYYWLIFSSARSYPGQFEIPKGPFSPPDTRSSQLYMAAIVQDVASGDLETFSAVYLWNQDPLTSNLTPAWDEFKIPPVPPPR